jgi:hypothetical protein
VGESILGMFQEGQDASFEGAGCIWEEELKIRSER